MATQSNISKEIYYYIYTNMKKTLLAIVALLAVTGFANASYTGDVAQYYENNKADYTLNVGELGNITVTVPVYSYNTIYGKTVQYNEDKVICKISYNMCYSAETALRAFGLDVDAFTKGYEKVTSIKTNFVNLYQKLYVKPTLGSQ